MAAQFANVPFDIPPESLVIALPISEELLRDVDTPIIAKMAADAAAAQAYAAVVKRANELDDSQEEQ